MLHFSRFGVEYRLNVTSRQTGTQPQHIYCASIASRGRKENCSSYLMSGLKVMLRKFCSLEMAFIQFRQPCTSLYIGHRHGRDFYYTLLLETSKSRL